MALTSASLRGEALLVLVDDLLGEPLGLEVGDFVGEKLGDEVVGSGLQLLLLSHGTGL